MLSTALFLLAAASALAYSAVIANGTIYPGAGVYGPRHTLTAADVDQNGGDPGCVNAQNTDGTWAGTTYCTYTYISHAYCGCALRYGFNGTIDVQYHYSSVVGIEYY